MTGENLSQDQIEALLREAEGSAPEPEQTQAAAEVEQDGTAVEKRNPTVETAYFQELEVEPVADKVISDMEVLLDIPLSISVELGKAKCYVKDLLNLTVGSIVELDRLSGDPVDILVNGKIFAKGEVVVIDENFGVRIQEILSKGGTSRNR